jgi:hypothetical protein
LRISRNQTLELSLFGGQQVYQYQINLLIC